MKKSPTIYTLRSIIDASKAGASVKHGEHWYPARPLGDFSIRTRFKAAWLVFTGKADAVTWPWQ